MTTPWLRWVLAGVLLVALAASVFYGLRTYRTFLLLESAQSLAAPETSTIRGWMTLDYLATTYRVDPAALRQALGIAAETGGTVTIREVAAGREVPVLDMVTDVQRVVAALGERDVSVPATEQPDGWFDSLSESVMTGVLVYGSPVLLAVVFFGSLGFPVPSGPVTALAGSLAANGQIGTGVAAGIAFAGSLLGDVVAYGVGRAASPAWLQRWGAWIGYTEANRRRAQGLFRRWGGATIVLGMSVVSQVSSVVGLLAGLSHWSLARYLAAAAVGRALWTLGYLGLGFVAGTNFSAASGFLANLGVTVLAVLIAVGAGLLLGRRITA